jgi:hypothetical protein
MRKAAAILCLFQGLFLGTGLLNALDWPSGEGALVNNFGGDTGGEPLLGTFFEAEGMVGAAGPGELVFSRSPSDTASRLPSPLGAWIALDHGDGLTGIYGRLDDAQRIAPPQTIRAGTAVARAGQSGWSNRRGFYFAFFDRRERRWVNPAMIITPPPDTTAPQILAVELRTAEGGKIDPALTKTINQGQYTLLVDARDARGNGQEGFLAPHRILCSVNGLEAGVLQFETYSARDGVLTVYRNGMVPVRQVYGSFPFFEIGEIWLTRGQANLEIVAQDIAGNARSVIFKLQVE